MVAFFHRKLHQKSTPVEKNGRKLLKNRIFLKLNPEKQLKMNHIDVKHMFFCNSRLNFLHHQLI